MKRENEAPRPRSAGRPPSVFADAVYLIRAPRALIDAMKARAKHNGVSAAALWREAARRLLEEMHDA